MYDVNSTHWCWNKCSMCIRIMLQYMDIKGVTRRDDGVIRNILAAVSLQFVSA
jgi:hypothetical protein